MTNWIDDLFGGQDKEYPRKDGTGYDRVSQTSENRKSGGEYPHFTRQNESDWHRSENSKTHSDSWNLNDDSRYSAEPDDSG